jgi:hypothetical protein
MNETATHLELNEKCPEIHQRGRASAGHTGCVAARTPSSVTGPAPAPPVYHISDIALDVAALAEAFDV